MFAETCIECQIKLQPETEKEKFKLGILSYKELLYVSEKMGNVLAIQILCKNLGTTVENYYDFVSFKCHKCS